MESHSPLKKSPRKEWWFSYRYTPVFLSYGGGYLLGPRNDLGYPGAGRHVLPDEEGADIEPLCSQGVTCASFTPADPFPLPYSRSPYAIKSSSGAVSDAEDYEDSDDMLVYQKISLRGYRRGKHHIRHQHQQDLRRPVDSGYFYYHHKVDNMGAFSHLTN